jgi:hypothetical protein
MSHPIPGHDYDEGDDRIPDIDAIEESRYEMEHRKKRVAKKIHKKGTKGPQHAWQALGKMSRNLANIAGETAEYKKQRSIRKHELKHK